MDCFEYIENVADVRLQHILKYITCIITDSIIPLIFALALTMFVWGVAQFVINPSEEAKREKGRQFMLLGVIALAVMVSVWGLVKIVGSTFGLELVRPVIPVVRPGANTPP